MILHCNNRHPSRRISRSYLEKNIRKALKKLKRERGELGVSLVTDREIASMNRKYLGRRGPTDVVSFPMESNDFLGDIVISLDTAAVQAKNEKRRLKEQVMILAVHGLLHLLGYDHVKPEDRLQMRAKERELCVASGIYRPDAPSYI